MSPLTLNITETEGSCCRELATSWSQVNLVSINATAVYSCWLLKRIPIKVVIREVTVIRILLVPPGIS